MLGIDSRAARVTWTIILVLGGLGLLWLLRGTLMILVCALLLAYLLAPMVDLVERFAPRRIPRNLALAVVYVLLITAIGLAGAAIGSRVWVELSDLSHTLPPLLQDPQVLRSLPLPEWLEPHREAGINAATEQLRTAAAHAIPMLTSAGGSILAALGSLIFLVLIPILSFLFLKDADSIRAAILDLFPGGKQHAIDGLLDDVHMVLTQFMRALVLISLCTFVAYSLMLSLLGVRYALLLSLVAGVLEFIPVAGPLMASLAIVVVAVFSGNPYLLAILGFLIVYRLFLDYVIQPHLMSTGVAVPPVMVIFGVLAGEHLAGAAGMFLSIPVLAILRVIYVRFVASRRGQVMEAGS